MLRQILSLLYPQASVVYAYLMGLGKLNELVMLIFHLSSIRKKPLHEQQQQAIAHASPQL
jgi:hypothetical protein